MARYLLDEHLCSLMNDVKKEDLTMSYEVCDDYTEEKKGFDIMPSTIDTFMQDNSRLEKMPEKYKKIVGYIHNYLYKVTSQNQTDTLSRRINLVKVFINGQIVVLKGFSDVPDGIILRFEINDNKHHTLHIPGLTGFGKYTLGAFVVGGIGFLITGGVYGARYLLSLRKKH